MEIENKDKKITEDLSLCNLKKLEAYVGGYFGTSYTVNIDFEKMELTWECFDRQSEDNSIFDEGNDNRECKNTFTKMLELKEMNNFIKKLEKVGILEWKDKYIQEGICDGTSWNVVLKFKKGEKEFYGSNGYPEKWDDFCKTIRMISGKDFS